jgi:site-specific DNA-methyltransferase (adenine-specific)
MATRTTSFGVGRREGHDSSPYYSRNIVTVVETKDRSVVEAPVVDEVFLQSAESMSQLPSASVALMVTSPPYHVGKDYDSNVTFDDYLALLDRVFAETYRVLQPGGRAVVNVANLGRRPYVPLSHLVSERMLSLGYFMRGEIIWRKARGASGNCAWGSWRSPSNPVIRDVHEYCLVFCKGRFNRAVSGQATISADDFMESTLSVWDIPAESAKRVSHPAPFPVELPRRFIELYTFENELVLDPFIGSGTTAVAAIEAGRHWVGYEIDEQYARTTRERAANAVRFRRSEAAQNESASEGA